MGLPQRFPVHGTLHGSGPFLPGQFLNEGPNCFSGGALRIGSDMVIARYKGPYRLFGPTGLQQPTDGLLTKPCDIINHTP
jgi:hypothetical protein